MTLSASVASALLSCFVLACAGQSRSDAKSDTTSTGDTTGTTGDTTGTTGERHVCEAPAELASVTNPAGCTDYEPSLSTECSEPGIVCIYDFCVFPNYWGYREITCTEGRFWEQTVQRDCQPPTCPGAPLVLGAACAEALTPGPCEFVNACQDSLPAYCRAGVWETECSEIETPPAFSADSNCPLYPPAVGDPCCPRALAPVCDFSTFLEDGNGTSSVGAATGGSGAPVWTPTGPIAECVSCNPDSFVWEESNDCE